MMEKMSAAGNTTHHKPAFYTCWKYLSDDYCQTCFLCAPVNTSHVFFPSCSCVCFTCKGVQCGASDHHNNPKPPKRGNCDILEIYLRKKKRLEKREM